METAIRIHTKVLPGHRIEISEPQLSEGSSVDVFVVLSGAQPVPAVAGRRELLQRPVEERRQLLIQQSQRLASHYEAADADRLDWQSGDIV
jgi:hypothetical protein